MDQGGPKDNKPPAPANSGISSLKTLKPKETVTIKPKDDIEDRIGLRADHNLILGDRLEPIIEKEYPSELNTSRVVSPLIKGDYSR